MGLRAHSATDLGRDGRRTCTSRLAGSVCDYCGYETRLISKSGATQFAELAEREIREYGGIDDFSEAALTSMFFGGGTASLLSLPAVEAILTALRDVDQDE